MRNAWDVRENAFVRCNGASGREEGRDSQRIQLSSLHREFTDVSAIIVLLYDFVVLNVEYRRHQGRNEKDEVRR